MTVTKLVDAGFDPAVADSVTTMHGRGCDRCAGTGYRGRVGVFEVMELSDSLREQVIANAPVTALRRTAMAEGMIPLRQSGLEKVRQGLTTVEEVVRETM
jgi:type II secretory ATPase GspE/PulE/Tfp pilus assembly ATPase PilB-like protein